MLAQHLGPPRQREVVAPGDRPQHLPMLPPQLRREVVVVPLVHERVELRIELAVEDRIAEVVGFDIVLDALELGDVRRGRHADKPAHHGGLDEHADLVDVANEFLVDPALGAANEWVLTLPTRRFYSDVANDSLVQAPINDAFFDDGSAGEEITVAAAKEIVAQAKKKRRPRRQKAVPADKLGVRLIKTLRRYQESWPGELSDLARHLREFADALDMRGKKKSKG